MFKSSALFENTTLHVEDLILCDIIPSNWVYRCLTMLNYFWQVEQNFFTKKGITTKVLIFSLLGFYIL